MKSVLDVAGLVDLYFPSEPSHGGFGLLNLHGVPKPSYRAFQLLHGLGTERLNLKWSERSTSTVEAVATRAGSRVIVLACNHEVPKAPIRAETPDVSLPRMPAFSRATGRKNR